MISKLDIVLYVYTMLYFTVIVVLLAKCESIPAVYLIESYLLMEPFESKVHLFSSFFFLFFGKEVCSLLLGLVLQPEHMPF